MSISPHPSSTGPMDDAHAETIGELGPWRHNIRLPSGEQTAPDNPEAEATAVHWRRISPLIPKDLKGATVLDIGCNAGFHSIELARRGARVYAIDTDAAALSQAAWAAAECGLARQVQFKQMNVYALGRTPPGFPRSFDIVVFLNVLHQLRYPMLGLDLAVERCADMLLFQCQTDQGATADSGGFGVDHVLQEEWTRRGPRLSLLSAGSRECPDGACWLPNAAGVEAMLAAAGLKVLAHPSGGIYICRRALAASDDPSDGAKWRPAGA